MLSKCVMNGRRKLVGILLRFPSVAASARIVLMQAITHARIESNEHSRHVRGNTPRFLHELTATGCKSEGTPVELGNDKIKLIKEFLDSRPMPI